MNQTSLTPTQNSSPSVGFSLQPVSAWTAILGLVLFTAFCVLIKAGVVLRLAFPAGAFLVGLFLFQKYPLMYVSYTWWLWFLTPFVRRLSDWQAGWEEPNTILLAPFLVTAITLWTLLQKLPKARKEGNLLFVLPFIGIFYGMLIGLVQLPAVKVVVPLLNWITPVLFGFYLSSKWREYPSYSQMIRNTFLWGVLVTGAYGIYQYVVAPEWDTFWLISSELITGGDPEPYGLRVFSTMNSAGPFAIVIMAGVLLLFSTSSPLQFPATAVGYLSLLLTLVRSAWLGWVIGFLALATSLKPKLQMRLVLIASVMVLCVLPLTMIEPFAEKINARFETLSDVQGDTSYNDRSGNYDANLNKALTEFIGKGLGGAGNAGKDIDSALLDTLFSLGWIGSSFYVSGLVLLLFNLFNESEGGTDLFASAARSTCFSIFIMLIFSSLMLGLTGVVFWGFMGIGTAANRYNRHQKTLNQREYQSLLPVERP